MFIVIEDLKEKPLHVRHEFPAGEIAFSHEDARLDAPVMTDFTLTPEHRDLRVSGSVKTAISFRCSRCAREFSRPFSAAFDLFYVPQPEYAGTDAEVELKYEDMEVGYYDGIVFDVNVMALEQIELAMPMQYVCREDCKGLCYKCGADLNEGACSCAEEPDARLSVLLEFQKKLENG